MSCDCCGGLYLAAGSRLTYVGDFDLNLWQVLSTNCSNQDVIIRVQTYLNNTEGMIVEKVDLITHALTRTLTLQVKTAVDHGGMGTDADNDIRMIIDHAFYTQANVLPTASRITDYTPASPLTGAPMQKQKTGAPCAPPPSCQENPSKNPLDSLKLPSLTPLAWGGLVGLLGLGALLIFLKS